MPHGRPIAIRASTVTPLFLAVALARTVAADPPPSSGIVTHGSRDVPMVALTFDACPTKPPVELDDRIPAELVAAQAPATFFVSGRWAKTLPDAVRRLAAEPLFEIGNHSTRHPHLKKLDAAHVRTELAETQDILEGLAGRRPRWFRPPFGEVDARIAGEAAAVGLGTINFDVASGDPAPGMTKTRLVHAVLANVRPGSIVVLHANHRRFPTADALPEIIAGLRAKGFELVTVSRLVDGGEPVR
jgi:peptidoglycan/xylan/chitin deacetylase (PgdA/CDA1 family)